MAQQTINIGAAANDGTGDPARTAFGKVNDNFDELYAGQGGPVTLAGAESSYVLNATDNTVDSAASYAINLSGGSASFPSHLGKDDAKPAGTDLDPGWAIDSSYVSQGVIASSILGGYDQVVNAIGSVVVNSNHSMISYGTEGHNTIVGNSYNWIKGTAGRSGIFAARQSSIQAGNYNVILGGDNSDITASGGYNSVLGGSGNVISGTSVYCIASGIGNTLSGASAYAAIISGNGNAISGGSYGSILSGSANTLAANYSGILNGANNNVSGNYSAIVAGDSNTCAKSSALVTGRDSVALSPSSFTLGRNKLVEVSDAQTMTVVQAIRTTNATLTNLSSVGEFIELNDAKVTAGTGKILLVGMRDGSADGNNDADYTQVAYTLDFGFWYNGTNGFLFTTGTETTVTSAPTLNMVLMSQANNDFTAGAAPHVAINTGSLRVKVTGIAATYINWVARIDLVMTVVS